MRKGLQSLEITLPLFIVFYKPILSNGDRRVVIGEFPYKKGVITDLDREDPTKVTIGDLVSI